MKTKINLIPPELRKKEKRMISFTRIDLRLIAAIILPIILGKLFVFLLIVKLKSDTNKIQKDLNNYTQKISTLKVTVETDLKAKQEKMDKIKSLVAERENQLRNFGTIKDIASRKRKFTYDLLKLVAESITDDVWLDELDFDKEKNVFSLKGFSFSHPKISLFLTKLNTSPYLKDIYMKFSEKSGEVMDTKSVIRFAADGKLSF